MDNKVNLLVIEDNPADADLIREYLSEVTEFKAHLHCVSTLREGQDYLKENPVHAVLVDLTLPDSRGLETVKAVVSSLKTATAIVLTSLDDKDIALDAIESGAQDYLLKGSLGPDALSRVIRYSLQRSKWQYKINEIQEQLFQSQKMESIGRLAGGVAHDFNNQLAIITLLCSLIQNELPDNHSSHRHVEQILAVSERSVELIKRLLAFSRRHPMELKIIDLHELVKTSEVLLAKLLGVNIKITVKSTPQAWVRVDSSMIEHAIMNLAINARDAMPKGGTLSFDVSTDKDRDLVQLKITDTGTGMPNNILEKVFEPFFTTKEIGKGTGLGLSMVYGTVKQCNGDISVESVVGQGTAFTLNFPYSGPPQTSSISRAPALKTVAGQETILVVEDEAMLQDLTRQILELHHYKVLVAEDGAQALKIFETGNTHVDLVLTDLSMPNMGGVELREKLLNVQPDIKVIFTSGFAMQAENEPALENVGYLPKPASTTQLLTKIREMLAPPKG